MRRPKPAPPFKTLEEEANFWDTHSVVEKWTEGKILKTLGSERKLKEAVIHVKLAKNTKRQIEHVARKKDISMSSLIRMWVAEKLNQLAESGADERVSAS